jgi:hypothetical protein
MRILVACLMLLSLTRTCLAADNDRPDLKSLYDAHRWFELRDSVAKDTAPVFYQGAVTAFNDLPRCEKKLAPVIKSFPQSDGAIEAHRLLASAYMRQGKYREAFAQCATNTDLYPPFAAAFPELIRTAAETDSYKTEGMGGAKNMDAATLSSLHFSIGGFPVVLSPAAVLLTHTTESSKFFHGSLGIDLLQQAHKTVFDFKAMTLTLQ